MIGYYTDDGKQIIMLTLSFAQNIIFGRAIVYRIDAELYQIVAFLVSVLLVMFCVFTVFGMLFVHISKVHTNLFISNQGNIKLLNEMHEGVLILEEDGNKVMLSNKPTQKLIKKYFSEEKFLDEACFNRLIFNQGMSQNTIISQKLPYLIDENNKKSLSEIILAQIDEPN